MLLKECKIIIPTMLILENFYHLLAPSAVTD
jgi:hypothetical protein